MNPTLRSLRLAAALFSAAALTISCRSSRPAGGILEGRTVVDLTHALNERGPHWPGGGYFPFRAEVIAEIDSHGVYSRVYSTPEHLGTHVDAPNHFEKDRPSLDQIPVERLFGPGVVIDIEDKVRSDADATLSIADVEAFERANGRIPAGAIVLLRTGWSARWNDPAAYRNEDASGVMHFPGYSAAAADLLARRRSVSALGIDTLSVDPGISRGYEAHHAGNRLGVYFIENVAGLGALPPSGFDVIVAPMKIEGGSGGQARVFAVLSKDR